MQPHIAYNDLQHKTMHLGWKFLTRSMYEYVRNCRFQTLYFRSLPDRITLNSVTTLKFYEDVIPSLTERWQRIIKKEEQYLIYLFFSS